VSDHGTTPALDSADTRISRLAYGVRRLPHPVHRRQTFCRRAAHSTRRRTATAVGRNADRRTL
jgi:hypothetical protein